MTDVVETTEAPVVELNPRTGRPKRDLLSPEQRELQKQKVKEYHRLKREGNYVPKNKKEETFGIHLPRKITEINRKLEHSLDQAINNIADMVSGKPTADKNRVEVSKWLINTYTANELKSYEVKIKRIEAARKQKEAEQDGVIDTKSPKEKAEEFGSPRLVENVDFEYDAAWDEEESGD